MTKIIKRKYLLSLMVIAVMVAIVGLISCGSDSAVLNPSINFDDTDTNTTSDSGSTSTNVTNAPAEDGGESSDSSTLDINKWFDTANWKKYHATIELNGKSITYTIVFRYSDMGREVDIYDEYDGKEHFGYTWGYASGRKAAFFLNSKFISFYNSDTIIINKYYAMSRLPENNYEENTYISRSHYYDKNINNNSRKEDLNDFALPKYIKLTSEGLLMTYYTYNTKTGDWRDNNQTALFKF